MQDQEARLEELKRYHAEYLQRFQQSAQTGISVAQLHEYRAFLAKLELAIEEQEKVVWASQQHHSNHKEQWQQKHIRSQVLDKVVARYQQKSVKAVEFREQQELDDRSQRRDKD